MNRTSRMSTPADETRQQCETSQPMRHPWISPMTVVTDESIEFKFSLVSNKSVISPSRQITRTKMQPAIRKFSRVRKQEQAQPHAC